MDREIVIKLTPESWMEGEEEEFRDLMGAIRYKLKYTAYDWSLEEVDI